MKLLTLVVFSIVATIVSLSIRKLKSNRAKEYFITCHSFSTVNNKKEFLLFAECKNDKGNYPKAFIDLNKCISIENKSLIWSISGKFLTHNMECDLKGHKLSCEDNKINFKSSIDLDRGVYNENGKLVCNGAIDKTTSTGAESFDDTKKIYHSVVVTTEAKLTDSKNSPTKDEHKKCTPIGIKRQEDSKTVKLN